MLITHNQENALILSFCNKLQNYVHSYLVKELLYIYSIKSNRFLKKNEVMKINKLKFLLHFYSKF
ncbi:MAG: hypothetical protein PG977_001146 [Bartonella clarridgeiae]|nr:MAG: hypothetical protein PG977_001146 [Bartonella clarridgeiae]